jgi:hypothetical protein
MQREHQQCALSVVHVRGRDFNGMRESLRIHRNVTLDAADLLARVIALVFGRIANRTVFKTLLRYNSSLRWNKVPNTGLKFGTFRLHVGVKLGTNLPNIPTRSAVLRLESGGPDTAKNASIFEAFSIYWIPRRWQFSFAQLHCIQMPVRAQGLPLLFR